ncbi:seprase [Gaeumannomyces tritici R3-111a-1]|uniref:Probable dipeptidyl-aminopeptidase B n=1 Tax=Gaeumannomyces tritici (strain R3-111a-1) TaxID=644352 RepID=J3P8I9_GAET3|nr:seprase [Gaeumannomyces tritici R3-111a-1]EJT72972.1 seprase [Gaeumannomyces tritici R3-111a-1]
MRSLATSLLVAALALSATAIDPPRQPHQPLGNGDKILTYNDTVLSPKFGASSRGVQWIATGGGSDGQYITETGAGLVFENIATGSSETFVAANLFPPNMYEYWVRQDLKKVLFAADRTKVYRHSYTANYFVLDVASKQLSPVVPDQAGDVQYAELAPAGDAIAFVRGNNLYLNKGGKISQITSDGGPDKFHGVPDWVYEEEIFGGRKSLWFSPDGQYIAFLSIDETGVQRYRVQYYMDGQKYAPEYPRELELRYPKVGTTNPKVAFSLLSVADEKRTPIAVDAFPAEDLIIGEVAWLTGKHASVLYRAYNRVQDKEKLVVVDVPAFTQKMVRERDGSDGWLELQQAITYVGPLHGSCNQSYYVDLSDESGWNHLYLHPTKGGAAVALTSGKWEVRAILKVDTARQLIYYASTERHSTESHLYSVSYATGEKKALVDDTVPAWWTASFSSGGSYYIRTYSGPDVPYQELYSINSTEPLRVITDNRALWDRLQEYKLPNITYFELENPAGGGYSLNVMQRLPANFDPAKKYPAIFIPYGGPNAQEVQKRFSPLNWKAYVASDPELEYITYTVDNRGTGFRGRAFRSAVAGRLGTLEAEDQVFAARAIGERFAYVDAEHVAFFGHSYGGFLGAKVVELDSGVYTASLMGAPVTDWRFYDSMYTERYMKTPQTNGAGYNSTAVRRTAGFKNIKGGSWIFHGTGDDNVHYQNTAALVDLLVGERVPPSKLHFQAHTDSDHSIVYNGAGVFMYKTIIEALYQERNRKGDPLRHQWSRKSSKEDARFIFP